MERKFYKNTNGEVYAYDQEQIDGGWVKEGLVAMTDEEVHAHLNPPLTKEQNRLALKAARDAAHDAMCFELASGKLIQLRPNDFAIIQNAVAQSYSGGWVMADNTVGQVTTDDLIAALAYGAIESDRIFQEYITALEAL